MAKFLILSCVCVVCSSFAVPLSTDLPAMHTHNCVLQEPEGCYSNQVLKNAACSTCKNICRIEIICFLCWIVWVFHTVTEKLKTLKPFETGKSICKIETSSLSFSLIESSNSSKAIDGKSAWPNETNNYIFPFKLLAQGHSANQWQIQ